jgi:C1A family cysteine protease
VFVKG